MSRLATDFIKTVTLKRRYNFVLTYRVLSYINTVRKHNDVIAKEHH